jgi:pyruvate dehydrogenase E1 component beta subunit
MVMAREAGISVELIDLRTIYPMDRETIAESVRKTGRFLSVAEGPESFGTGAELTAAVTEEAFLSLEAPPTRLAGFDVIPPFPKNEDLFYFKPDRIFYEIKKLAEY